MTNTPPDERRALLQSALRAIDELQGQLDDVESAAHEPIAIVGMSCRFPGGATSPEAFWDLLCSGRDAVSEYPAERRAVVEAGGVDVDVLDDDTAWFGGFLDQIDQFDPQFFGISPREASTMDPQQRLVLEVSWEALERAAIAPDSLSGSSTGVFVGITGNEYIQLAKHSGPETLDVYSATGGALNAVPGRVAYTLGLQGPCMAIDTACSSSLVAVHQACQSLRVGESDLALAGGVNLLLLPEAFMCFNRWGMMAADGRCKTFDAAADGFVRGEGCGMVVLKRLSDAIAASDPVLAVIDGSAVNQDGRSSGLTVPNGLAQQDVVRTALARAQVDPSEVQYFEAHGTGTKLGDPIEIEAIGAVFGHERANRPLTIGSVKTNIGHLESAAGIAGLIKVVLAMQHGEIPPNLHFCEASTEIPWPEFPMPVPTSVTPWPSVGGRRVAGVSGFGFSGTNAHVVVESAPESASGRPAATAGPRVVALSARDDAALRELATATGAWIEQNPEVSLPDVSTTINSGRARLPERLAVVARSSAELASRLSAFGESAGVDAVPGLAAGRTRRSKVAFMFTGQGAQYVGMAHALYETEPVFARALDECAAVLDAMLSAPLYSVLFADPDGASSTMVDQTEFTQPATFAVQFALAAQWHAWGVEPDAVLGHSVGEFAAAVLAGVLSLEDAARLVVARGALMQALPAGGAMAAISTSLAEVESVLDGRSDLAVAAVNAPGHTVVSGTAASVAEVAEMFVDRGVTVQELTVSHAFHSPLMAPMLDDFRRVAESISYRVPNRRFVSTVTGSEIDAEIATADYWVRHVMAPVRFADAVGAAREAGIDTFVEIGPHPVLVNLGGQCLDGDVTWVYSLRRRHDDAEQMLAGVAQLFAIGARVDLESVRADGVRRALPTYPFQRQRCWLDPAPVRPRTGSGGHPLLGSRVDAPLLGATIHEAIVSTTSPAWLDDHRLSGTVVFPATGFTELVLAATDPRTHEIASMSIVEPLIVPASPGVRLQTVTSAGPTGLEVEILSLGDGGGPSLEYSVHARASVGARTAGVEPATVELDALWTSFPDEVPVGDYYEHLRAIGLTYGETFRSLSRLARRPGAAIGLVELPAGVHDRSRHHLHPALFDACFHVLGVAIAPFEPATSDDMYVPVAIDGLRVHVSGATAAWCVVTLLDAEIDGQTDDSIIGVNRTPRDSVAATLALYDADGSPIASVDRLEVRRTPASMWKRGLATAQDDPVYDVSWRSSPHPTDPGPSRAWLIVADRGGVGSELAAVLGDLGSSCTVIDPLLVDGDLRDALDRAYQTCSGPIGVVHLRSLDAALGDVGGAGDVGELEDSLGSALATVQVLGVTRSAETRLWFVTRGAQATEDGPAGVTGAALWGFGRVVANEHPELSCSCIDLDPDVDTDAFLLAAELVNADVEDQVALRSGRRRVARLVHAGKSTTVGMTSPTRLVLADRGSIDSISTMPLERQSPAPGEVEVAVRATGLNFRDVVNVLGLFPGDPGMPGLECAGVVSAVGEGVTNLVVGDAVVGIAANAYDSHVLTRAQLVVPKPSALSFAEAATIPIAYLTARYGLQRLAALGPGDRVLIHAAAGGVGMAAVHVAQQVGAEVYATVGSAAKRRVLQELGVRHIYSSRTSDFADQIRADTGGEGVDVVLNSLADDFIPLSFGVVARGGRFLEIGKRGIWTVEQAADERPDVSYHPYDLADIVDDGLGQLLLEVVDDVAAGRLAPLPVRAFPIDDVQHAFRFMAQARHIGKIVVTHPPCEPVVRPDGSYLITGGLGGLGLATAEWLVEMGARTLTLVGRSGPADDAVERIEDMESAGAQVTVVTADIADPTATRGIIAAATAEGVPLRGVFHEAGVTDDGVVTQQTWDRFERVLAPKVGGALLLDRATRALDLDFFVLFSSASALLGAPGQSNYAAANSALDAVASSRRASGLPATSINWGPWSEVGMASHLPERQRTLNAERGIGEMSPDSAFQILGRLLAQHRTHAAVMEIDWHKLIADRPAVPALLTDVSHHLAPAASAPARRRLADELADIDVPKRRAHVGEVVADQVRAVLGLDPTDVVDPHSGLSDLGMDSLMAVELSNRLSSLLGGRSLPTTIAFEYPTLTELADHVVELVAPEVDLGDVAVRPAGAGSVVDSVPDMSSSDVEDALIRELEDAGY